ncbi:hypothetical protein niasHS_005764 [Heterodera schachtii]|uniref:Uncharacterized protein n=2 Tax=Heterodera TaxID=34509 RepID=A0ABD2IK56_9BILA
MELEPIIKQKHKLPREKFPNDVWHRERYARDSLIMLTYGTATVIGVIYTTRPTWSKWLLKLSRNRVGTKGAASFRPKSAALLVPFVPMLSNRANHSTFPHNLVTPTVHRRFVIAGRVIALSTFLFAMYIFRMDERFIRLCENIMKEIDDDDH